MKVLHVSDLHLHAPWLTWVLHVAPGYDLVVVAGDHHNAFLEIDLHKQVKISQEWLVAIPAPTLAITGNHDHWFGDRRVSVDVHAEGRWLRHIRGKGQVVAADGDVLELGGRRIAACGWLRPRWPGGTDVVVYHAPPCAMASEGPEGDADAATMIRASPPVLFLSGHIHEPDRFWCFMGSTLVLVPGVAADENPIPNHWVVDLEARVAIHSSGESVRY